MGICIPFLFFSPQICVRVYLKNTGHIAQINIYCDSVRPCHCEKGSRYDIGFTQKRMFFYISAGFGLWSLEVAEFWKGEKCIAQCPGLAREHQAMCIMKDFSIIQGSRYETGVLHS